jgi:hypothetical protein
MKLHIIEALAPKKHATQVIIINPIKYGLSTFTIIIAFANSITSSTKNIAPIARKISVSFSFIHPAPRLIN